MDDVRRGRVFDVMDLAHIAGDHQDLVGLKFHESGRWYESVNRHRAPADPAENIVHFLDPRNTLERDAGIEQPLKVDLVSVLAQKKNVLPHNESPHRVVDRRIVIVALVDRELQKMLGKRSNGGIG